MKGFKLEGSKSAGCRVDGGLEEGQNQCTEEAMTRLKGKLLVTTPGVVVTEMGSTERTPERSQG